MKKLRIAAAGLGRAFSFTAPAFTRDPRVELVAGADPSANARSAFKGKTVDSVEALCALPDVDVIYIATPHQLHAAHARLAFAAGKHVLVEKPMALTLEDCQAMTEAARKAGVALVVGPSHSFDLPILHTKKLIAGKAFGSVRMITAVNFTDFFSRRKREPLDTAVHNQAPHQVDIVRLLAGSRITSVKGFAAEGSYSCALRFESGASATLAYNGYGHYSTDELMGGFPELGRPGVAHEHFGLFIVSCDKADLRPLATGVMIYQNGEQRLEPLPAPQIPRQEVIDELYGAVVEGKPPLHSGEWGTETMRACLALQRSAREGKEISP